jgi:uncharacterized protein (DUF1778 family)
MARARSLLRDRQDLVLSREAFDRFIAELDRPGEAVPELVELFARHPSDGVACGSTAG